MCRWFEFMAFWFSGFFGFLASACWLLASWLPGLLASWLIGLLAFWLLGSWPWPGTCRACQNNPQAVDSAER